MFSVVIKSVHDYGSCVTKNCHAMLLSKDFSMWQFEKALLCEVFFTGGITKNIFKFDNIKNNNHNF